MLLRLRSSLVCAPARDDDSAGSRSLWLLQAGPTSSSGVCMLMRCLRTLMQVPHTAGAQQRSPAAPAQPRSSGNSPMLWMQPGGGGAGGGGEHQPYLQQPTPFQAMQQMQLDGGLLARQRAMIRQQVQAQQVRLVPL